MPIVSERLVEYYSRYYGGAELRKWRRISAIDKAESIRELTRPLPAESVLDIGCWSDTRSQQAGDTLLGELNGRAVTVAFNDMQI